MPKVRAGIAILLTLAGSFFIFNWFMLPKDEYFWRLNLWPFLALPLGSGILAWFVQPRSNETSVRVGHTAAAGYSVLMGFFLLSFTVAFATNNTYRYWRLPY